MPVQVHTARAYIFFNILLWAFYIIIHPGGFMEKPTRDESLTRKKTMKKKIPAQSNSASSIKPGHDFQTLANNIVNLVLIHEDSRKNSNVEPL